MTALRARDETGRGQVVDTSLVEPLLTLLGPQLTAYDLLGELQPRTGNRSSHNAPRNLYRTADGSWVAVSSSATSIAARVLRLVGRGDLAEQEWFGTGSGRAEHVDEIDEAVAAWIGDRDRETVMAAFEEAGAAVAPVYDAGDVLADPQLAALGSISTVDDLQLGPLKMPNVISRLSETPGRIRYAGGRHGCDNQEVYTELGVKPAELALLIEERVV
jgi:formyl-CoA transferase